MCAGLVIFENFDFRDLDGSSLDLPEDRHTWHEMHKACDMLKSRAVHTQAVRDVLIFRYAVRKFSEFEILHELGGLVRFGTESLDSEDVREQGH